MATMRDSSADISSERARFDFAGRGCVIAGRRGTAVFADAYCNSSYKEEEDGLSTKYYRLTGS